MHSASKVKDLKDAETNLELVDPFKYLMISICLHIPQLICLRQIKIKHKEINAMLTKGVIYFARDPLRSLFDECQ